MCQAPFCLLEVRNNLHLSLPPSRTGIVSPVVQYGDCSTEKGMGLPEFAKSADRTTDVHAERWHPQPRPLHSASQGHIFLGLPQPGCPPLSQSIPNTLRAFTRRGRGCLGLEHVLGRADALASSGHICVTLITMVFVLSERGHRHGCPACLRCFSKDQ